MATDGTLVNTDLQQPVKGYGPYKYLCSIILVHQNRSARLITATTVTAYHMPSLVLDKIFTGAPVHTSPTRLMT